MTIHSNLSFESLAWSILVETPKHFLQFSNCIFIQKPLSWQHFNIEFPIFHFMIAASSSTTISSGLKAQTWSPWSPHHQALFHRPSKANHNNWTTPILPIRRASMMSSKNDDESYVFHSAKKHFTKINTFNGSLSLSDASNSMENVSIKSNPF